MADKKIRETKSKTPQTPPSNTTSEQRAAKRRLSTSGLNYIRREVEYLRPNELSAANRLYTYQQMLLDPDVFTPYDKTKQMVELAFSSYTIEYNKDSEESKNAREFLLHCIECAFDTATSLRSIASHAYSYTMNKLAICEKVYEKVPSGEYKDFWALTSLPPVHLSTLDLLNPFKIDDHGRKLSYARQNPNAFTDNIFYTNFIIPRTMDGYIHIPRNKLALFTDSADNNNPFGTSVFDAAYSEWRFKMMVKEILLTGVAKDMAGLPVFYVPSIIMEEAQNDPNSWQASFLQDLDQQGAAMHNGDQSFIRLPSDLQEGSSSVRDFDVVFKGIDGGGKGFDLVAILEQSKKAIYNCFGAQNLLAGEGSGGSYNLIEGQNGNHAFTVKRNVKIIEEVWNKDIVPQLFRLNEWNLSAKDMPKLRADGFEISIDELGKFVQRVGTSGYLPVVPEVINHILSTAGFPFKIPEDATKEELMALLPESTSAAGKGNGTSGLGNSHSLVVVIITLKMLHNT